MRVSVIDRTSPPQSAGKADRIRIFQRLLRQLHHGCHQWLGCGPDGTFSIGLRSPAQWPPRSLGADASRPPEWPLGPGGTISQRCARPAVHLSCRRPPPEQSCRRQGVSAPGINLLCMLLLPFRTATRKLLARYCKQLLLSTIHALGTL